MCGAVAAVRPETLFEGSGPCEVSANPGWSGMFTSRRRGLEAVATASLVSDGISCLFFPQDLRQRREKPLVGVGSQAGEVVSWR